MITIIITYKIYIFILKVLKAQKDIAQEKQRGRSSTKTAKL